jgi:6-phosphogluconolactonase
MPRPVTITYRIAPTPAAVAQAAAEFFTANVVAAAQARGLARVAISGGTTPKTMFALLANPSQPFLKQVPWDKLELFWVDERCVPPDHPESNYRMTNEALLSKVPLPAGRIHRMEGELEPEAAAARYESVLRNAFRLEGAQTPTFDLILLGMGDDGHTASLFPHTDALHDMTHLVVANHVPQKDTWRITLTWPVINQGREVAFLIEVLAKRRCFTTSSSALTTPKHTPRSSSGLQAVCLPSCSTPPQRLSCQHRKTPLQPVLWSFDR